MVTNKKIKWANDKIARIARPQPNWQGFLTGNNHPEYHSDINLSKRKRGE